jgi:hypothetical protein
MESAEVSSFKKLEKLIKESKHVSEIGSSLVDLSSIRHNCVAYKICDMMIFNEMKEIYGFRGYDGFYVIRNSLPLWLQIEMAHLALADCPEPPNTTSLGLTEVDLDRITDLTDFQGGWGLEPIQRYFNRGE